MICCTKCKEYKTDDKFVTDRKRTTGKFAWCKDCTQNIVKERRERENIDAPAEQKCNRCHEVKALTEENFGRCRSNFHGFQYECKPCKRERRRAAYRRNPDKEKMWMAARRMRPTQNGPVESVSSHEIFVRDGWTCKICHEAVDGTLKFPDPHSPSLDHIVPLSLGGTHTYDNLQLAHLECNLKKGNRVSA